jgi:nitroreductase/NAD-dependent dihydropyrimidine dehydrogenase PreA subunit
VRFEVDQDKCNLCGACIATCPTGMVRDKRGVIKISWVACIHCGHCMAVCPTGAISVREPDDAEFAPAPDEFASPDEFAGLLRRRRTVRRFLPDALPRETLEELLEAARWVPTAANCQCQEFLVLTDEGARAELRDAVVDYYRAYAEALAAGEGAAELASGDGAMHDHILAAVPAFVKGVDAGADRLFFDAPAVIVVHARRDEVLPEAACGFSTLAISLMAEAMGLGTCITAYASLALQALPELRATIGVPDDNQVHYAIAVGRPAEEFRLVPHRRPLRVQWN